jgi:hypothetical protein
MKETKANRPSISQEAKRRILAFVRGVEALQEKHGIKVCVQDDTFAFHDSRRTDKWNGYGEWDAQIFDATDGYKMSAKNVRFETFALWGK